MKKILAACLLGFVFSACSLNDQPESEPQSIEESSDSFETATRREDLYRFPLLEPYEAFSTLGYQEWFINLPDTISNTDETRFTLVGVKNRLIILYSEMFYSGSTTTSVYIRLDTKSGKIIRYYSDEAFYAIAEHKEISLHHPDRIFKQFENNGKINWK